MMMLSMYATTFWPIWDPKMMFTNHAKVAPAFRRPKRHSEVAICSGRGYKIGFCFILHSHQDLMVSGIGINEAQHLTPGSGVNDFVDMSNGEIILRASFVEVGEFNPHSPFPVGFLDKHRVGKLFYVDDFPNHLGVEEFFDFSFRRLLLISGRLLEFLLRGF